MNTVLFSIACQPYSPNRITSCTSRQHSELLRFTELVEEFRMFKTDNSHGRITLLLKYVISNIKCYGHTVAKCNMYIVDLEN